MDIQYSTDFWIQKLIFGFPIIGVYLRISIIHVWISINRIMDIHKSILDIQKAVEYWISKNRSVFKDIHYSFLDIQNRTSDIQ